MFTRIFKSDYLFQLIFFLIISVLIWIRAFNAVEVNYSPVNAPLFDIFQYMLKGMPYVKILISFILLIFQALILKNLLSSHDLMPKNSLLPSLVYVLLMSSFSSYQNFHPLLIGNLFIIIVLHILLSLYNNVENYEKVFNATFLAAIASLFYFPFILFILFIWFSFLVLSLLKWREWLISMIGFMTPYILVFSYYFMTDVLKTKLLQYQLYFIHLKIHFPHFALNTSIILGVLGILLLISIFKILSTISEKQIYYRKYIIVLLLFLLLTFISFFFVQDFFIFHICLFFIPFSFFFSNYVLQINRLIIAEIIYFLFFGCCLYNFLS
ncbi:MAG: hypothetical protein NTZ33_00775 [Bacteroidetes bacterium]|nr:hypothetical protein [Bacteroidota bacterium]